MRPSALWLVGMLMGCCWSVAWTLMSAGGVVALHFGRLLLGCFITEASTV
jgi:hypothetical protein